MKFLIIENPGRGTQSLLFETAGMKLQIELSWNFHLWIYSELSEFSFLVQHFPVTNMLSEIMSKWHSYWYTPRINPRGAGPRSLRVSTFFFASRPILRLLLFSFPSRHSIKREIKKKKNPTIPIKIAKTRPWKSFYSIDWNARYLAWHAQF